jgi:hypothetical protein
VSFSPLGWACGGVRSLPPPQGFGKAADKAAKATGKKRRSLEKAEKVVEAAEQEPPPAATARCGSGACKTRLSDPDAEATPPRSPMRLVRQRNCLARTDKPRTRADAIKKRRRLRGDICFPDSRMKIVCKTSQGSTTTWWRWRIIDGKKCWYPGKPVVDKSQLTWEPPEVVVKREFLVEPKPSPPELALPNSTILPAGKSRLAREYVMELRGLEPPTRRL